MHNNKIVSKLGLQELGTITILDGVICKLMCDWI